MQKLTLVIFGGTGDLTKRKLIPALYRLICVRHQLENIQILAVGRKSKTDDLFRQEIYRSLNEESGLNLSDTQWSCLSPRIGYETLDFIEDKKGYAKLEDRLRRIESSNELSESHNQTNPEDEESENNRLYYLAIGPEHFTTVVENLVEAGMAKHNNINGYRRFLVEKPFGTSLADATALNKHLLSLLDEKDIFRIDHYLGKEMLQNILAVRFGNAVFEPLWNHRHIDHIKIISNEVLGVEERGGYFDKAGILKDMVQNHLLQMLALIAMEPPVQLDPESIRNEKVKVLQSLRLFSSETVKSDIIRGQYGKGTIPNAKGETIPVSDYRSEDRVKPNSETETFVWIKTWVDNIRWGGVPFYLVSGKRMSRKETTIIIQFKPLSGVQPYAEFHNTYANRLVFNIQPREGFHFAVNGKRPEADWAMDEVIMEYCQSCRIDNNSPEAYERILLEASRNNASLFARWDELYHSWRYVDSIAQYWSQIQPDFPNYAAGTDGPEGVLNDDNWKIDFRDC